MLMVDFDDTDRRLRLWDGADLVGVLRPNIRDTPLEDLCDLSRARWTGWISNGALQELTAAYEMWRQAELRPEETRP